MTAAVVKLDALTDSIGATADDDDFLLVGDPDFVFRSTQGIASTWRHVPRPGFIGRVIVRCNGRELRRAGVDEFVDRLDALGLAVLADLENAVGRQVAFVQVGKLGIAIPQLLGLHEHVCGKVFKALVVAEHVFKLDELLDLVEEPRVDVCQGVDLLDAPAHFHGVADVIEPALTGHGEFARQFFVGNGPLDGLPVGGPQASLAGLQLGSPSLREG